MPSFCNLRMRMLCEQTSYAFLRSRKMPIAYFFSLSAVLIKLVSYMRLCCVDLYSLSEEDVRNCPVSKYRARIFKRLWGQEIDSKECSLAGRYDNPIPPRFLAPIDCIKIPAQSPYF